MRKIRFRFKAQDAEDEFEKMLNTFSLKEDDAFKRDSLNRPYEVEYLHFMSPDQYIKLATENLNRLKRKEHESGQRYQTKKEEYVPMTIDDIIAGRVSGLRSNDFEQTKRYDSLAERGELPVPWLDWNNDIQDGLHRAVWAKEKGMKEIPVLIWGERK